MLSPLRPLSGRDEKTDCCISLSSFTLGAALYKSTWNGITTSPAESHPSSLNLHSSLRVNATKTASLMNLTELSAYSTVFICSL